jgi:hypothetical protein
MVCPLCTLYLFLRLIQPLIPSAAKAKEIIPKTRGKLVATPVTGRVTGGRGVGVALVGTGVSVAATGASVTTKVTGGPSVGVGVGVGVGSSSRPGLGVGVGSGVGGSSSTVGVGVGGSGVGVGGSGVGVGGSGVGVGGSGVGVGGSGWGVGVSFSGSAVAWACNGWAIIAPIKPEQSSAMAMAAAPRTRELRLDDHFKRAIRTSFRGLLVCRQAWSGSTGQDDVGDAIDNTSLQHRASCSSSLSIPIHI